MRVPFPGIARKLAIPFLILTTIGWIVADIGAGISVANDRQDSSGGRAYPLYFATIGGFFTLVSLYLHAASWKPGSTVVGAITSVLTILWLTSLGMVTFPVGNAIRNIRNGVDTNDPQRENVAAYLALEFAGTMIALIFMTPVLILWFFYDGTTNYSETTTPFQGLARKIALPFIALTAVAWLLVVIGFGIGADTDPAEYLTVDVLVPVGDVTVAVPMLDLRRTPFIALQDRTEPTAYLYFIICVTGPFLVITAVLHAMTWKPISNIIGGVVSFSIRLGMVLITNGNFIDRALNGVDFFAGVEGAPPPFDEPPPIPAHYALEFAGALLATIFWTPVMVLWHFYDGFKDERSGNLDIKGRTDTANEMKLDNV